MFVFKKPPKVVKRKLYKSNPVNDKIVDRLNRLIDKKSPVIIRLLYTARENQLNAITYKELREAYMTGYEEQIRRWQDYYTEFINENIKPVLLEAMKAGAINAEYISFNASEEHVMKWLSGHTGALITNINESTRDAIKTLLMYGQAEGYTADQMAKIIRPVIGLTKDQAIANMRYQNNMVKSLLEAHPKMKREVAEKKAQEAALKYAGRQNRQRAQVIANTELAYAYNNGYHENMRQAMQAGLISGVKKVWSTAYDERTCPICGSLNGVSIGFDESFDGHVKKAVGYKGVDVIPPAHPSCRCTIMYVVDKERYSMSSTDEKIWLETGKKVDDEVFNEIKKFAKDSNIELSKFNYYDGDVALLKEYISEFSRLMSTYPELAGKGRPPQMKIDYDLRDVDYAEISGRCISINGKMLRSRERLIDEYRRDVLNGKFVSGGSYLNVIRHELGHLFHRANKVNPYKLVDEMFLEEFGHVPDEKEKLMFIKNHWSDYAAENKKELVAEVFANINSEKPNEYSLIFFDKYYRILTKNISLYCV